MCTGSSGSTYKGTLVQKIFPGQFFMAGRQGRRDKGEVKPPMKLVRNVESVESIAFILEHCRGGLVSLALSENDYDVWTIAAIPTYKPSENIRQYNDFAELIGDGRAKNARAIWNKPLKTVYISDCGELKVVNPTLSPSLP
ncbi:unnamed protein product [Withania somnifera]